MRAAASAACLAIALQLCGCATGPGAAVLQPQQAGPAAIDEAAVALAPAPAPEPQAMVLLPLLPRPRLDPQQDAERSDLWVRLRDGFAMADLDGELVRKWEQWYAGQPGYVQRMTGRGSRYLFHVVEEVQRRGMPTELALLPFIESAFNPQAVSSARASGMWQFMPGTGKDFELRQNVFRDDRRDVLASTRAALDFLQRLYTQFGDWQLALAAYNWGPGNVQRALERNRRAGLRTDYPSLRMPVETREYVPKLQAVKNIVRQPEAYGLTLPALENHPFFLSVAIDRDIDVALAAELAGLPLDEFQQLNPQLNKPVILAAGTPQVLLPYENANRFVRELTEHQGALASWTAWVAPKTLKPAEAARLTGMDEALLREVNLIPPRMLVRVGSTLLVPRPAQVDADVSGLVAEHAMMELAPEFRPLRRVAFKAGRSGDSVAAVARRWRVSTEQVATWNGVSAQARFRPGQSVVVMLPSSKVAAKSSASKLTAKLPSKAPAQASAKAPKGARASRAAPPPRLAKAAGGAGKIPAAATPPRVRLAQDAPR